MVTPSSRCGDAANVHDSDRLRYPLPPSTLLPSHEGPRLHPDDSVHAGVLWTSPCAALRLGRQIAAVLV